MQSSGMSSELWQQGVTASGVPLLSGDTVFLFADTGLPCMLTGDGLTDDSLVVTQLAGTIEAKSVAHQSSHRDGLFRICTKLQYESHQVTI